MTDSNSAEVKKRNHAQLASSENVVHCSTDSFRKQDDINSDNDERLPFKLVWIFSGLDSLQNDHQHSTFFENVNLTEMVKCLEDLIDYFAQPEENIGLAFSFSKHCTISFYCLILNSFPYRTRGETTETASPTKSSGLVPGRGHSQPHFRRHR